MSTKKKQTLVALVLCIFLGWLGVHRFYQKKWKSAVLYFFTAGIFGFGWLVDTVMLLVQFLKAEPQPAPAPVRVEFHNEIAPAPKAAKALPEISEDAKQAAAAELAAIPMAAVGTDGGKVKKLRAGDVEDLRYSSITTKTNVDKLGSFVAVDVETTGLHTSNCDLLEVSAVKFESWKPVAAFTTLLCPSAPIPAEATKINGITDDMVEDAPTFGQILPSLQAFLSGSALVGHNLEFDLRFLHVNGLPLEEGCKYYDTLKIAQAMLKPERKAGADGVYDVENHKLGTLCAYYGIAVPESHRALADAYATGMLLHALAEDKKAR